MALHLPGVSPVYFRKLQGKLKKMHQLDPKTLSKKTPHLKIGVKFLSREKRSRTQ